MSKSPQEARPLPLERGSNEHVRASVSDVVRLRPHLVPVDQKTEEVVKMRVIKGSLVDYGAHEGCPSYYYIAEDSADRGFREGSVLMMAQRVLGDKALILRADPSMTSLELAQRAEELKSKLEKPEVQGLIRELYEKRELLKEMLK